MSSILTDIKNLLGIDAEDTNFDTELVIFINAAISKVTQLGVGPEEGFSITGTTQTWEDLIGNFKNLQAVKDYIYIDVRLIFDPPSNAFVVNAYRDMQNELAWRITVMVDDNKKEAS